VATFFVFKIRTSCTECGEGIVLEGPRLEAKCEACGSVLPLKADYWKNMFSLRSDVDQFGLTEGKTRGSSLTDGERRLLVSWGPQRPPCIHCGALLDLAAAPPGTDGEVPCACGGATPTFPPPPWLAQSDPGVMQIFGAPREGPPGGAPASPATPAAQAGLSLVSFACPDCGANLKVTPDLPRVLRCTYCQSDSFLPDALWRALHPVKKRTPFYVAFR
jgi:DNA-directed RNA polymerase subunit RPC12/RpoP